VNLLIVGGTGNISWRLSQAALAAGFDTTVLNRGAPDRKRRAVPAKAAVLQADVKDPAAAAAALGKNQFDAVIDFVCYNDEQARQRVEFFRQRTAHYIFISSTAIYDRAVARTPLTEDALATCPWDYAAAKAGAENVFNDASRNGFPVTILRPGHTYDTIIPEAVGDGNWTNPWRMLNGRPVVLHGDGTTLWTLTHSSDFARAIVEFLKSGHPPGDTFHITADETHTWREITAAVAREIGAEAPAICYRTTEEIDRIAPRYGNGIKFHKMWCDIYDNRKFQRVCPSWRAEVSLADGIRQTADTFRADAGLHVPDGKLNGILDTLCAMR
jgi:nucleoside-diphosphate-sugar epimerase